MKPYMGMCPLTTLIPASFTRIDLINKPINHSNSMHKSMGLKAFVHGARVPGYDAADSLSRSLCARACES